MSSNDILGFISETLIDGSAHQQLNEDDDILTTGLLDSIALMHLIIFIEQETNTRIPVEDVIIDNFQTVAHIMRYLQEHAPTQDYDVT